MVLQINLVKRELIFTDAIGIQYVIGVPNRFYLIYTRVKEANNLTWINDSEELELFSGYFKANLEENLEINPWDKDKLENAVAFFSEYEPYHANSDTVINKRALRHFSDIIEILGLENEI